MVYDSSGNLAPAPRARPVEDTPDPVAAAKAAQAVRAAEPGYVAPAIDPVAIAEAAAAAREAFLADAAALAEANDPGQADRRAAHDAAEAAKIAAAPPRLDDATIAANAAAAAREDLTYNISDTGALSADLAPTPFATAEFNLSTDLFI
jgi:hypothetical protein